MTTTSLLLIDDPLSTECYAVRLFLNHQQISYQSDFSSLDALDLQIRPAILIHGTQQIDGVCACLNYLSKHCVLRQPLTRLTTAQMFPWQQLQQQLQQSLGRLRQANLSFDVFLDSQQSLELQAYQLLKKLNDQLCLQSVRAQAWLCDGKTTSIADFLIFPLVALSRDAGLSVDDFVHIQRWLQRMQQISGYIAMPGLLYG